MKRSIKDLLLVSLRGIAMGAADIVPGVSGGTIAFITGIYEELIDSLKSIDHKLVRTLFREGPVAAFNRINGVFLAFLAGGILLSVFSLSKGLSWLLETYPEILWGFFFGLILASAVLVGRRVGQWTAIRILVLLGGAALAFAITLLTRTETPDVWWFYIISGAIAICAMILPGISGSFLLLMLGKYEEVLNAVKNLDFAKIAAVGAGAVIGLISFSHLLSWLFKKFHDGTVAFLTGIMLGSLNKVWPWKNTLEYFVKDDGEKKPLLQENVWPGDYAGDNYLMWVLLSFAAGILIVYIIEKLGNQKGEAS